MTTPSQPPKSDERTPIASLCRSFADLAQFDDVEALGELAASILREHNGAMGAVGSPARAALIEAVRAGKHVELRVRATVFRQKDGAPNKNFLRFKSSKLEAGAPTWNGQPFLVDHDKWSQSSRKGTIESSEAVPLAGGWTGFRQTIRVVKPDAVISVLDGTIDRFSIGWDPSAPIHCTVHGVDVRSRASCYRLEGCYPGKAWTIDGETKIAEYEFQSIAGLETSGVNTPAVTGTKIEDVRAALAAELGLAANPEPQKETPEMRYPLLVAALSMTVAGDTDPDDATLASKVEELAAGKLAAEQERDAAITRANELAAKVVELEAAAKLAEASQVDAVLAAAYKAGKLIRGKDADGKDVASPREVRLRKIAKVDGLSALEAELSEMPVVVPVGRAELEEEDPNPRPARGPIPSSVLASTAKQLGLKPEELSAHANLINGEEN